MIRMPDSVLFDGLRGVAAAALVTPLISPLAVTPVVTHAAASGRPSTSPPVAASAPLSLSVAVSDGRRAARPGDLLGYVVSVRDLGSAGAAWLTLTQTLPPAFRVRSAGGGAVRAGTVTWRFRPRPQASVSFRVSGLVGATPPRLLRLDTIACVTARRAAKPIVCAVDSDALPAAASRAANAMASRGQRRVTAPAPAGHWARYALAAAGLGVLVAAMVLARRWLAPRGRRGSGR
jgi:hypothetical protein